MARTRTSLVILVAGVVATTAAACDGGGSGDSGDGGGGSGGSGGSDSAASWADLAYADATCAGLATCCAMNGFTPIPLEDCLAHARQRAAGYRADAAAAGGRVNDDAAARTCIAEVRQLTTSCSVDPIAWFGTDGVVASDPCRYVFGPPAQGAPCQGPYDAVSCAPGFTCRPTGSPVPCCHGGYATPSQCEGPFPPVPVGSYCETVRDCVRDAYCDTRAGPTSGVCAASRGVGETCATAQGTTIGPCVAEAYCDYTTLLCQAKLPAGSLSGFGAGRCASGNVWDSKCLANAYWAGPSHPGNPYSACLAP